MKSKFALIILVLNIGAASCDRNLIIKDIAVELCDTATSHTLQLVQKYFSDQDVVTLIVHELNKKLFSNLDHVIINCIVVHLHMPIYQYYNARQLELQQSHRPKNILDTPSVTSCYMIIGHSYDEISEDLNILSKINPTAKYIFLLINSDTAEGEQLLNIAWHSYKMLSVVVIMGSAIDHVRQLDVVIHNPFICYNPECQSRGKFYKFHITDENHQTTVNEIVASMDSKLRDFHKYPLRIYMYEWRSFARAVVNPLNKSEIIRFRFLDGEILTILARHLNFKTIFIGNVKNNTVDGSVRAVDSEEADIAANSRIISNYSSNNTVFLAFMYLVTLKYTVPKQYTTKMLNVFIYSMFDWNTEVIMIAIFIILILVWYLLNYFYEQFTKQSEANSIPRALIIVTASQHFVAIKFTKFLKGHQQILLGSMLLYSLVVSSNFQSSVVKQLAIDVEDRDINTLEDLVNSPYEIQYVQTLNKFLKLPSNLSQTSTLYKLYKRQTMLNESIEERVRDIAYNKSIAILSTKLVAEEFASQYLDEDNGRPLLHIVQQPLSEFYYSYIVPKSSPYRRRINEIIQRAIESGILKHEQQIIEWRTKLNAIRAIRRYGRSLLLGVDRGYKGVQIQQIKTLFMVWGYLLTLALFVFIIELSVFYLYPQYQKYHDKHDL